MFSGSTGAGQLMQPTYARHAALQKSWSGYSSSQALPLFGRKVPSGMGHSVESVHSSGHCGGAMGGSRIER